MTGYSGAGRGKVGGRLAWSLRTAAVLVGCLNAEAYGRVTSSEAPIGDWAGCAPWTWTLTFVFLAGCAGLVVAEILLRSLGDALRRDFWSRALAVWLGFVVGGMLVSLCVGAASLLAVLDLIANNVSRSLVLAPFVMVAGAAAGLYEGFVFALPLAALLGLSLR